MTALIVLLPMFGFATVFNIVLKRSISVAIFFSITFIITILYVFGMLDLLKIGSYILFYCGILILLLMSLKYKSKFVEILKSVPFVIFTIASIGYLYMMKDAQFFFWDEYSHWGVFIKEMYYFGHFYDSSSVAANLSYPPGISTWDYFIVSNLFFSEGNIYFSYFLILFSSTLMMYEKLQWKQIHWILLIFIIQMVLFATYGHWFSSIYVDHVVGSFFAGIVLAYLADKFEGKEILLFIFPLISLVLIKEVGLYFGVIFLGLVFLLKMYDEKFVQKNTFLEALKMQKKTILIFMVFMFLMISILKIWESRQESNGIVKPSHSLSVLAKNIIDNKKLFDKQQVQEKYNQVFFDTIAHQQLHKEQVSLNYNEFSYGIKTKFKKELKLSTLGTYVFFIVMSLLVVSIVQNKVQKYKILLISSYMLLGSIIYLMILYLSMPLSFGTRALNMVSYIRYINMSILPLLFIGFSMFTPMVIGKKEFLGKSFSVMVMVVLVLSYITRPYLPPMYSQLGNGFRKQMNNVAPKLLEHIPAKSNVLVVFPVKNNGSLNIIIKYMMIPTKTTVTKYDFFDKKTENDVLSEYAKYDYIWFASINQSVMNKSKQILKSKEKNKIFTLYKIEKDNNQISAKPIL